MQAKHDKLERKRMERERKQAQREVCIAWTMQHGTSDLFPMIKTSG